MESAAVFVILIVGAQVLGIRSTDSDENEVAPAYNNGFSGLRNLFSHGYQNNLPDSQEGTENSENIVADWLKRSDNNLKFLEKRRHWIEQCDVCWQKLEPLFDANDIDDVNDKKDVKDLKIIYNITSCHANIKNIHCKPMSNNRRGKYFRVDGLKVKFTEGVISEHCHASFYVPEIKMKERAETCSIESTERILEVTRTG